VSYRRYTSCRRDSMSVLCSNNTVLFVRKIQLAAVPNEFGCSCCWVVTRQNVPNWSMISPVPSGTCIFKTLTFVIALLLCVYVECQFTCKSLLTWQLYVPLELFFQNWVLFLRIKLIRLLVCSCMVKFYDILQYIISFVTANGTLSKRPCWCHTFEFIPICCCWYLQPKILIKHLK
jgi:hypothetical protein